MAVDTSPRPKRPKPSSKAPQSTSVASLPLWVWDGRAPPGRTRSRLARAEPSPIARGTSRIAGPRHFQGSADRLPPR